MVYEPAPQMYGESGIKAGWYRHKMIFAYPDPTFRRILEMIVRRNQLEANADFVNDLIECRR